ncbi:MAG: hypothetical protein AAF441_18915 [Pseudomonadota bacterium]
MSKKSILPTFAGVSAFALVAALGIGSFAPGTAATTITAKAVQSYEIAQNFSTGTQSAAKKKKKKRRKKRRRRGSYHS